MENLTNWCVYMHENRENGKKYIGITSQKPTNRWQNGEGYQYCPRFYAAIKKYGWDAFRHDILYTGLTQEAAEQLEVDLIAKYGTQDPEKGYNMAEGGGTNRGYHLRDETKQRIGTANRGKRPTPETLAKLSASHKGRTITSETRDKMSRAHDQKPVRAIREGEPLKTFPGVMVAHRATGVSESSIIQCCKGIRKTAGGYRWEYAEGLVVDE